MPWHGSVELVILCMNAHVSGVSNQGVRVVGMSAAEAFYSENGQLILPLAENLFFENLNIVIPAQAGIQLSITDVRYLDAGSSPA